MTMTMTRQTTTTTTTSTAAAATAGRRGRTTSFLNKVPIHGRCFYFLPVVSLLLLSLLLHVHVQVVQGFNDELCYNEFEKYVLCHAINDTIEPHGRSMKLQNKDLTYCPHKCQICKPIDLEDDDDDQIIDQQTMKTFYEHVHCGLDYNTIPNIWNSNTNSNNSNDSMNQMYERIITDPNLISRYRPTILSHPKSYVHDKNVDDGVNDKVNIDESNVGIGPWLLQLEDFFTEEECDEMVRQTKIAVNNENNNGDGSGYAFLAGGDYDNNGYDDDGYDDDGVYGNDDDDVDDGDNNENENDIAGVCESTQAWCDPDQCMKEPKLQNAWIKIEQLVDLPFQTHTEPVHFIQYVPGQKYGSHTDSIPEEFYSMTGPRLFTILFYLNDIEDDNGGETCFSQIIKKKNINNDNNSNTNDNDDNNNNETNDNDIICVQPKKGRALIWPNVRMNNNDDDEITTILSPDDSNENKDNRIEIPENRTWHEANPINYGFKYAGTVWYHLRNFSYAEQMDCTDIYTDTTNDDGSSPRPYYLDGYDGYNDYHPITGEWLWKYGDDGDDDDDDDGNNNNYNNDDEEDEFYDDEEDEFYDDNEFYEEDEFYDDDNDEDENFDNDEDEFYDVEDNVNDQYEEDDEYLLTDDEDDKDYNDHRSPLADDDDYNDSDQEQG